MQITVPKEGTGHSVREDEVVRPDTNVNGWQFVEERPTEFVIEILDE